MFHFSHPVFLWLLLLLPLAALLKGKRGQAPAVRIPSVENTRSGGKRPKSTPGRILKSLEMLALASLIIALARPQFVRGNTEVEASGVDILLSIDVSGSMEAMDFAVDGERANRLEAVKNVVKDFIKERPNDRIGLVAFAGRPYLVSPLTLDHDWLEKRLDSVKIGQVEDGTAIGSAVASSVNHLRDQDAKSRMVILLTDGMNNSGKANPLTAAEAAKALGIKVYTIGAGTRGEAPIPMKDAFGRTQMRMAKVDIDEATLTDVAKATGGRYFRATDTDSLGNIYDEINQLETTTRTMKRYQNADELFAWALVPGLALLGVAMGLGETVWRRLP
ncbi:MAG: VWA domain-containing protein [Verrucomicrobiales bacterium]